MPSPTGQSNGNTGAPARDGHGGGWVIINPESGGGDHSQRVRAIAAEAGYEVHETHRPGDAVALAGEAVDDGVGVVVACGGDGTIHEVLRGLYDHDGLDTVTLGVLPTGTANILAGLLGIEDIEAGFDVLERGETRELDVGVVNDEPFVVSCVAGLTAEASKSASSELKSQFGTAAFVLTGIEEATEFDPMELELHGTRRDEPLDWSGKALCLLVGNSRRFAERGGQADAEDGLLNVTIVEPMPATSLTTEAIEHRLFGRETENVDQLKADHLDVTLTNGTVDFSLDGETSSYDHLSVAVRPRALDVYVGRDYDPTPESN